ncbi:MAG TPA: cupin domain-containing protein [Burkholderiales bacterium]|nr:cupin domain-containing protein [Burkholderiales bacterium]
MIFNSKDFSKVPNQLEVKLPDKLIHKAVDIQQLNDSNKFSLERQHFVSIVDLPSKIMSMTIGGLEPRQSTRKHRHNYETLIFIVQGVGKSIIENKVVFWESGDAIYVPIWAWHQHINLSEIEKCQYVACENAPLLLNLGEIALREEG